MLEFGWLWTWALLPLPFLVYWLSPAKQQAVQAMHLPLYRQLASERVSLPSAGFPWIWLPVWLCLLLALSRPQWLGEPIGRPQEGRDVVLAVDLSDSMAEDDMTLNGSSVDRLSLTKSVLREFISARQGDRLGLVLFADNAYLQAPLTFDVQTVQQFLDEAVLRLIGRATAIGDAIGLATKHMVRSQAQHKVLILLTDGQNTAGALKVPAATALAVENGVKIYTVGVGADEKLRRSFFGTRRTNPSADLDEASLQQIAKATGGDYFRARDGDDLQRIYAQIHALEPVASSESFYRPRKELYYWPFALAVLLSCGLLGWQARRSHHA